MTMLLLPSIETIARDDVSFRDVVLVPSRAEVRYAESAGQQKWVAKPCSAGEIIAEAIGFLMSTALNVPVPAGVAVVNDGSERWWLGALVAPVGHWSVARAQSIANPDDLAAIVALDAILGNDDRHAGNLLVCYDSSGVQRVVAIDFAGSWCGVPQSFLDRGHATPSAGALAEGITVGLVGSAARAAATGISAMTERQLHAFAYEACRVARFGGADELADALVSRCASARAIIDAYLEQLP